MGNKNNIQMWNKDSICKTHGHNHMHKDILNQFIEFCEPHAAPIYIIARAECHIVDGI